jgi:hypothetical protein
VSGHCITGGSGSTWIWRLESGTECAIHFIGHVEGSLLRLCIEQKIRKRELSTVSQSRYVWLEVTLQAECLIGTL